MWYLIVLSEAHRLSQQKSKRTSKKKPIKKIIGDGDTPLPQVWSNLINHEDNKADVAWFLSERLIEHVQILFPPGFFRQTVR